ncbi:MAG TPA: PDZ domain-containing protein [Vicinamibacterales bacterium]|nr:PDZ domain-containing protein [Vicinamibacterales bacterium]
MSVWKTAAVTAAVVAAAGVGAAIAPVARGQVQVWTSGNGDQTGLAQVLTRGSQIGVSIQDVDEEVAKRSKLPSVHGVLIEEVTEGSPAEKAGMRAGDIVVEFDGERVRSARQFARMVQETPPDRQVPVVVMRDGQRTPLTVQPRGSEPFRSLLDFERGVRVYPSPAPPAPPAAPRELIPRLDRYFSLSGGRLGITVETLSEQLAEYFGTTRGVLVSSVEDDSVAAKAGLKAGDVITGFNGNPVDRSSDLTRRVQRLEDGDEFTLDIVRNKQPMTLKGKLEPRQPRRWTIRSIV